MRVNIQKAKKQIKKGNEDGAKLYAQQAQVCKAQQLRYLQMSTRMDAMSEQINQNQTNADLMNKITHEITPILQA